jgi:ribose/xylose/arabinose/galactoside ABC-type transport system permease subunit
VLSLLNVTSNMQMIVKGVIIFVAVALDSKVRKR